MCCSLYLQNNIILLLHTTTESSTSFTNGKYKPIHLCPTLKEILVCNNYSQKCRKYACMIYRNKWIIYLLCGRYNKIVSKTIFSLIVSVRTSIVMYNERVKSFKCIERLELYIYKVDDGIN